MSASNDIDISDSKDGSNNEQEQKSQQSLIDSLISGKDRNGVGGILCNDPSGLCLASRGRLTAQDSESTESAGVYTNLVRLASQLQQPAQQNGQPSRSENKASDSADGPSSPSKSGMSGTASGGPPLITIEYENSAVLVKEYEGHAVAVRVPCNRQAASSQTPSNKNKLDSSDGDATKRSED